MGIVGIDAGGVMVGAVGTVAVGMVAGMVGGGMAAGMEVGWPYGAAGMVGRDGRGMVDWRLAQVQVAVQWRRKACLARRLMLNR
jgi:hypothetical protein